MYEVRLGGMQAEELDYPEESDVEADKMKLGASGWKHITVRMILRLESTHNTHGLEPSLLPVLDKCQQTHLPQHSFPQTQPHYLHPP